MDKRILALSNKLSRLIPEQQDLMKIIDSSKSSIVTIEMSKQLKINDLKQS